jgi:cellulose synthase/poly-beta-1,6-N-acetylglucosamine synthase-like glycosyltransferase
MIMISVSLVLMAGGLLLYAWFLYPLIVHFAGSRHARPPVAPPDQTMNPARVSVLFAAYNEEAVVGQRLDNLLSLPVSPENLHILVGVDGATDRTVEVVRAWEVKCSNIHLFGFPQRRGKMAVLKDLVKEAEGFRNRNGQAQDEILVFTDANTMFRRDAVSLLLRHFADPRVGGVCGRLAFRRRETESSENSYWELEAGLKQKESLLDSCLGANGAIYAVRQELFPCDIPDNVVVDDFVIGMKIREKGFRMVFDPNAVAEEDLPPQRTEWGRRVRIGSGDYQALSLCWRCLLPRCGRFAWMFWSHKVLRWFTPHLVILLLAGSLWLVGHADLSVIRCLAAAILVTSAALFGCALAGRIAAQVNGRFLSALKLCDHFVTMQAALLVGFLRFSCGGLKGHWSRTPRSEEG